MSSFLKEVEKRIEEVLPPEAQITSVEFEGPEIVVQTKNLAFFLNNEEWIKKLASRLKKRVLVRSDPSLLMEPEKALEIVKQSIPQEAGIAEIRFNEPFRCVEIEAKKLGLVIGKHGNTLKKIALETGWMPKLLREPTKSTEIVKGIRQAVSKESKEVKKFLTAAGKRIYRDSTKETEWIKLTSFGGAREVGRSCFLIETPESKIMLDCGVSVSADNGFPYLSALTFPLSELDAVILSHAHLDHCGFIPYLYAYGYEGPVYCTPPTRDVSALLQFDYMDVLKKEGKTLPYKETNIRQEAMSTITREYGEVTDITPDIRLTLHNAGHILGSAAVHLHIGKGMHNLLYTGDMKSGFTKLFDPCEMNFPRLETLMIESTYGGPRDVQPPRYIAEKELYAIIRETIEKKGSVLIPVFAIGRAQEIMIVLEELSKTHNFEIPVYIDGMCLEASAIHTAYPEYMRRSLQRRILHDDSPFDSEIFINTDQTQREEAVNNPSIILAPAGMMNGGPVIDFFKRMCENEKNTLIFVGYQGQNTLGRKIQRGVKNVILPDEGGKTRSHEIKMRVETVDGFSGHSDRNQLIGYIKRLRPRPERVITVHGEENKCLSLAKTVSQIFRTEAIAPRNLDSIRIR